MLDERALRLRLGLAARELAERCYGWSAIGARLTSVYADVLADANQDWKTAGATERVARVGTTA